jgi:hypothetical protein
MALTINYSNPGLPAEYVLDSDPTVFGGWGGTNAELASILYRTDIPSIYRKTGPTNTDWTFQAASISVIPRTVNEIAVGAIPVDFKYPVGTVDRYGVNTTPGTTDMTVAANTAISVMSQAGGGVVSWLAAKYLVGSSNVRINYVQSGILHSGASRESTQIVNGSANFPAITCGDGITAIFGGGVTSMSFSQLPSVTAVNGNCATLYSRVGQFLIRDVFVSNNTSAPYRGVVFTGGALEGQGCSQFILDNLQVQGCLNDGITFVNCVDPYIINCRSDANTSAGWVWNGTQGALAVNCSTFGNSGVAWNFISTNPGTNPNKNNAFVNCVADTSGSYNWQIADSKDSRWVGCWAGSQKDTAVNTFASGFFVVTSACTRLSFDSCIAITNNAHGFVVFDDGTAPTNCTFSNCHYVGNGRSTGGGYGFICNGNANAIRLDSGSFSGNATGPFLNQSVLTDIIVTGSPVGFVSVNQGVGTVTTGTDAVIIAHGLGVTPNLANIQVTDASERAASGIDSVWISTPTASTFTVKTNVATTNFSFVWRVAMNGN